MVINVAWFLFYWEPEREARSVILLIQGFGGLVPLGPTGRTPAILQCVGRAEGKKYTTSIRLFRNAAPPAQPELFVCYHCDMQSQAAIQQQTRTTNNWERVGENYSFGKKQPFHCSRHSLIPGKLMEICCTLLNKWKMKSTRLKWATNFKGFLTKIKIRGNWTNCAKKEIEATVCCVKKRAKQNSK